MKIGADESTNHFLAALLFLRRHREVSFEIQASRLRERSSMPISRVCVGSLEKKKLTFLIDEWVRITMDALCRTVVRELGVEFAVGVVENGVYPCCDSGRKTLRANS
jgi:hypothetical protein